MHGMTLEMIIIQLEQQFGWEELGRRIKIKCFTDEPSVASSLKFLRRTPWARQKVEALYIRSKRPTKKAWCRKSGVASHAWKKTGDAKECS